MEPSTQAAASAHSARFFGPRVVRGAFVLAMCGWGLGFYGPPVYLHAVLERTGWSLAFVSGAVTLHYLLGAWVVTRLPRWHARFGVGRVAVVGAVVTTVGVLGWASCREPWQLALAAVLSGSGWVTMGAVAVNAAIAPWYERTRPLALAKAYNGASVGGVVFSPLWVSLIAALGFGAAALAVGVFTIATMAWLAVAVFATTPERLGQRPDGDVAAASAPPRDDAQRRVERLWRDRRFQTLAAGMAIGLFAQIGLLAHLFNLLVPVLGAPHAGWAMGFATACAIGGRYVVAWAMPPSADRRAVAALAYAIQLVGTLLLARAPSMPAIVLAIALFGSGIGNATSLPPLIAQAEFARADVSRVVAGIVATAQATYAFAPAVFGALLAVSGGASARIGQGAGAMLAAVACAQIAAIGCFVAGRRR